MESYGRCGFSESREYYGHFSEDGKLRIWDTKTNYLLQEYTPDSPLLSPCVSLVWFKLNRCAVKNYKDVNGVRERVDQHAVALGMLSGKILVYSLNHNDIVGVLDEGPSIPVRSLSWTRGSNVYSSAGEIIMEWSIRDKKILRKWKGGKYVVTSLLVLPKLTGLLSAEKSITLWSLPEPRRIRTFTGHASDICSLAPLHDTSYFISAGNSDRFLSVWNYDSEIQSCVAQLIVEDFVTSVTAFFRKTAAVAIFTRSGVIHYYHLEINGKVSKPIPPHVTVRIASETCQSKSKEPVTSIPVIGGKLLGASCILMVYGSIPWIRFERMTPEGAKEKLLYLVREDPRKGYLQGKTQTSKVMQPDVGNDVQYLNQALEINVSGTKRGRKDDSEVPMEDRLNNLTLIRPETSGNVPRADSTAHLLLQALVSKDKKMINKALSERDEAVIKRTVSRLPMQVVLLLVEELASLMHGKVGRCRIAARWLRIVIIVHASHILANPAVTDYLGPIMGLIDTRLSMLNPLLKLRGRLDLLMDQLASAKTNMESESHEGLLVYQDSYSSDEESLGDDKGGSDVDENWDEFSDVEEEEVDEGDPAEGDQDASDQDDMSVD